MNDWKLHNGQWVRNWDHPDLVVTQDLQGPSTLIVSKLLDRLKQGPCLLTSEEEAELDRLEALKG